MKKKYLIVVADYYKDIAKGLLDSSLKLIPKSNTIKIIRVPGVFEIPVTISKNIKKYDAFLALGCVIKGKTPHFDFICLSTFNALINMSVREKKPIGNGIAVHDETRYPARTARYAASATRRSFSSLGEASLSPAFPNEACLRVARARPLPKRGGLVP